MRALALCVVAAIVGCGSPQKTLAPAPGTQRANTHFHEGRRHFQLGEMEQAVDQFNKSLAIVPNDVEALLYRGKARQALGQNDAAISDFDAALQLGASELNIYLYRARSLIQLYKHDEAIDDLERILSKGGPMDRANALAERGVCWIETGDFDKAISDLDASIKLDPEAPITYHNRGYAWRRKGEHKKAIADFNVTLRHLPQKHLTRFYRAMCLTDVGEYEASIRDYDELLRSDSKDMHAYVGRAYARSELRDYDRAIADLDQAIRLESDFFLAYQRRGTIWYIKNKDEKAIADFTLALKLNPKDTKSLIQRGQCQAALLRYEKALADFDEAVRVAPDWGTLETRAFFLSTCPDARLRNGKQAIADATRACKETEFKDAGCLAVLALAYAESGDFAKAIDWQAKATKLAPGADKAKYALRMAQFKAGRPWRVNYAARRLLIWFSNALKRSR